MVFHEFPSSIPFHSNTGGRHKSELYRAIKCPPDQLFVWSTHVLWWL